MRKLRNKLDDVKPLVAKIREGGTEAVTASQALINLDAVPASLIDKAGGVLSLDVNRKLKPEVVAGLSVTGISIDGPASLTINQVQAYTITDYDSFLSYTITAIGGSVSRSGDTITYTAPASAGASGFIINGKTISIAVGASIVMSPTINNIVNGANNVDKTISLTTTPFTVSSGSDTHQWTDWQIATDSAFTTIISQSLSDTVNKTSWTSGTLQPNTTYYARVRHKGNSYGYSNWGTILTFTTKITFTPVTETTKIVGGQSYGFFGQTVAVNNDGTRVVVGAYQNTVNSYANGGGVYIYVKSGSSWILEATLSPSVQGDTGFGYNVSIDSTGTRVAIGCTKNSSGSLTNSGAVYVFTRSGTTWTQEAKLIASGVSSDDNFGRYSRISGDGIRIFAPVSEYYAPGAVYVFTRSGTAWTQEAKLIASDATNNYSFGSSVSINSDCTRIIVGSNNRTVAGLVSRGSAYIFLRTGTTWAQEAILEPQSGNLALTSGMGSSVDIDSTGTRVVIGAPTSDSGKGYVFIFLRTGTSWAQEVIFTNVATTANYYYGRSVSISDAGDTVVVGASGREYNSGAAYAHTRSGTSWDTKNIILGSGISNGDFFGQSIDISGQGNVLVVGCPGYSGSGFYSDPGALFIFT